VGVLENHKLYEHVVANILKPRNLRDLLTKQECIEEALHLTRVALQAFSDRWCGCSAELSSGGEIALNDVFAQERVNPAKTKSLVPIRDSIRIAFGQAGLEPVAREVLLAEEQRHVAFDLRLGLIGFAVQQVYAAITCRLERDLDVAEMRREAGKWAVGLSRFGVAARAIVFALLGWGIVVAGWFRDASEVGTTASSFRILAAQPGGLGRWLLGVAAAGFVAYGLYQIIHARYLHIRIKR
jgi:hypothetical protein